MVLNFFYLPNEAAKSLPTKLAPMIVTKIKLVRLLKYLYLHISLC